MTSQSSDGILIIGAGPAGMAAAHELVQAGQHVTIVEKADQIGGLAKTYVYQEAEGTYRTDNGPHRFFSKNQYLYQMIGGLLGEQWIQVPRFTRFFVDGKFYNYPVRFRNALGQMGLLKAVRVLTDYAFERLRAIFHPRRIQSFEDFAVARFGRTLAEFNMLNYTEKIWGVPCSRISVDWASQRIAGLSLWSALKKMLIKKGGPKTLVDSFYYPDLGSGLVYEHIRQSIEEQGNDVLISTEPTVIHWAGRYVSHIDVRGADGTRSFSSKAFISSVPAPQCVQLFTPAAPDSVLEAATHLRFRAQVYLFLTIDKDHVTHDNWVYFPNEDIPFARVSEMKNFSEKMCPPGKTSLFVEFFCFEGDAIWKASKEELLEMAMQWLDDRLHFIQRKEVLSVRRTEQPYAYPIYDIGYQKHVNTIMQWLDSFENFYSIGRPGRFRYTNQDHSLEMGILTARGILEGKRYNIDSVGAGQEYFEQGAVPEQDAQSAKS
ncbi:MAG: FAD-dependent oxidoreductase [Candidatus Peribacteraceae bacterium]|jgi:protoporphyrinogen oxidase